MTRRLHVIGIGAGSPGHLTQEALAALGEVDVVLVADKGEVKEELTALRRAITDTHAPQARLVTVADPERGPDAQRGRADYEQGVRDWHAARTAAYVDVLDELGPEEVVGFLVWGDPAFYDSTIRVVDAIAAEREVQVRVVPGITAFSALAAAHGIVLHEVGAPVHVTTGRRLLAQWQAAQEAGLDLGSVVVMLDGHLVCQELAARHPDTVIHWGAYVGMPQQELRSGRLGDVVGELIPLRAELRRTHGWVMDVYVLTPPRR